MELSDIFDVKAICSESLKDSEPAPSDSLMLEKDFIPIEVKKENEDGGCEFLESLVDLEKSPTATAEFDPREALEVVISEKEHASGSLPLDSVGENEDSTERPLSRDGDINASCDSHLILPDEECNDVLLPESRPAQLNTATDSVAPSTLRAPRKRYRPRKFKCDKCEMAFKSGYDLRIHSSVHTGEKPYACEICGRTFSRPGLVTNHMHVHTGIRKFSCDTCGRSFTTSSFLTVHKRVHTGERPFECDLCGQKFSASCILIAHKRRHSEHKPFMCDVCGKAFKVSNDLHAHRQTHSGSKPFFCEVCGKMFGRKSHLSAHMIVHKGGKPHVCSLCQASFARPYNLSIHLQRNHPGEKTFLCNVCEEAFISARELYNHKRTHKDKPCKVEMQEEEVVTSILT